MGQLNCATHKNVFEMMLSPSIISPISGPVLRTNSLDGVWGSAVGVVVQWEPFDFRISPREYTAPLVVAVPEANVSGIEHGLRVTFSVPA